MKNYEYLFVSVVTLLSATVVESIVFYLIGYASFWPLLVNFIVCCFVAVTVFCLFWPIKRLREEYRERTEDEHNRWHHAADMLQRTTNDLRNVRQTNIDRHEQIYRKRLDDYEHIFHVLRTLVWVLVYQSAIGKLRNGDKEKALKQIKETEDTISELIKNPTKQPSELFSKLDRMKGSFEKILSSFGKHTDSTD